MGTGYGNGFLIIMHELTQKLGSRKHRNAAFLCSGKFRIVRMDGCRIDDNLAVGRNIRSLLADTDAGTELCQMLGQLRSMAVGAGYRKAFLQENLGEAAHADATDADKVNRNRIMKMKLIHMIHILIF